MTDFAALYRAYAADIRRHCYYHVRGDWENVAAAVWLRALEAAARGHGPQPGTERGWLWSIVHTAIIDHQRHLSSQQRWMEYYASLPTDSAVDTERVEMRTDLGWLLQHAGLTEEQQAVMHARYVQDMLSREIAAEQGIGCGAVRALQARAMRKLRAIAEQEAT